MSLHRSRCLAVVTLLALAACAPSDEPDQQAAEDTMSSAAAAAAPITQQEVDSYSDAANEAIRNGDTAAFANFYADDAVMISARGKIEGGPALVAFWNEAVRAGAGKNLQTETLKFGTDGDLAWALHRFTGGVTAPAGHTLRVFQRQPDGTLRTVVQLSMPDIPAQQ